MVHVARYHVGIAEGYSAVDSYSFIRCFGCCCLAAPCLTADEDKKNQQGQAYRAAYGQYVWFAYYHLLL